jgi:hypothetical protein
MKHVADFVKVVGVAISRVLMACLLVNAFTVSAQPAGVTVTRASWPGLATKIEFELNGQPGFIGADGDIDLQPREGINQFKKTAYYYFGKKLLNSHDFKEESFFFNYQKGQKIFIGLSAKDPSLVYSIGGRGEKNLIAKLDKIETFHSVIAYPVNFSIKLIYVAESKESIYYDNSNSNPGIKDREIPIKFTSYNLSPWKFDVVVRWDAFDAEVRYTVEMNPGVNNERRVTPPISSKKYADYQLSLLSDHEKPNFVCKNQLNPNFQDYNECLAFYEREKVRVAEEKRLAQIENEFRDLMNTKEGFFCISRLKKSHSREEFWLCHAAEVAKTEKERKYLDASATADGQHCTKRSKRDDKTFWECYEKKVAETEKQRRDAQEKELQAAIKKAELASLLRKDDIARQCVEIGFEIGSDTYKDCYLKLKVHTEQVAAWRKLQVTLESQQAVARSPVPTYVPQGSNDAEEAARLLELAQRGLNFAAGTRQSVAPIQSPPPPLQIITPRGSSYTCAMMGAALRCR